jgi:hypothetical protein
MTGKHEHVGELTIDRATGEERCDECDPALLEELTVRLTGPGRCWGYSNSNFTWQVAKNLNELRMLPWVDFMLKALAPSFHQLSVSGSGALRAPWDRNVPLKMLMLEYDGGYKWCVLGGLENPELYGLPEWTPKYK